MGLTATGYIMLFSITFLKLNKSRNGSRNFALFKKIKWTTFQTCFDKQQKSSFDTVF